MKEKLTTAAQAVKHLAYSKTKRIPPLTNAAFHSSLDLYFHAADTLHTYTYTPERYRRSFLLRKDSAGLAHPEELPEQVPAVVYALWTGTNPLTKNRENSLRQIEDMIGIPLHLVTPDNLSAFVVEGFPLHPLYKKLSLTHRADYLRAYLAAYKGGGYTDIKVPRGNWSKQLNRINNDHNLWYIGGCHRRSLDVAHMSGNLGWDLKKFHTRIPGNGGFIARAGTPLALEWIREVNRLLDYHAPQLEDFPGAIRGERIGYPLSWNRILNQVHHPLCLKYIRHVDTDPVFTFPKQDYR